MDRWHETSGAEVLAHFASSDVGLSGTEARARLRVNGENRFREAPPVSKAKILLRQFQSVLVGILIGAGGLSFILGDAIDAIAILAIVVLNAAIGFSQELSAERSIAALKAMTAPNATLLRDGKEVSVPATDVVTGDILALVAGELVAADARVLSASLLTCVEAALTGESDAVSKRAEPIVGDRVAIGDRFNMVFMGTAVATGTARAVVVATAMDTELGRIAAMITDAAPSTGTPLQQRLAAVGRSLLWAAVAIVVLVFVLGIMRGTPLSELALSAVSLAVAAIPEGLPAVVTVALSLGAVRMARQHALVRRLSAVETLGSTDVICTDKTGTLTVGAMTVRLVSVDGRDFALSGEGYAPTGAVHRREQRTLPTSEEQSMLHALATVVVGCNQAQITEVDGVWSVTGDPTEGALLVAGAKLGVDRSALDIAMPVVCSLPFDSERKRSAVVRRGADGTHLVLVNGAPGTLLDCCTHRLGANGPQPLTASDRAAIMKQSTAMARQSLRVLGSARRELGATLPATCTPETIEQALTFVGLSGMHDPPRVEAKQAIAQCRTAGIRVVMITGDHPETALAIARELGIVLHAHDTALTGPALEAMSDDELRRTVEHTRVYARVSAAHKLRVVRAWQAVRAVVAMTGDGVNDAPAIKGADIGIAMGRSGTEVTKQAADLVMTDDNFATIVTAVQQGRGIYDNIRKTLQYLLAGNTAELLLMLVAVVVGMPVPLLPIHLLWINLVTDGLPALALAADPIDDDVMTRAPRPRAEKLANARFLWTMSFTGVLTAGVALAVYSIALTRHPVDVARSWAFTVVVFAELLRAFGARSDTRNVWQFSPLSNRWLVGVVCVTVAVQAFSLHSVTLGAILKTTPMSFSDAGLLLLLGAIPLLVLELVKSFRRWRRGAVTVMQPVVLQQRASSDGRYGVP